jgi:hypothetical protein
VILIYICMMSFVGINTYPPFSLSLDVLTFYILYFYLLMDGFLTLFSLCFIGRDRLIIFWIKIE